MMKPYVVYVTAKDEAEASYIAKTAVGERLAACANILGGIQSVYWWEDTICEGREVALILKTTESCKTALIDRIKALHSYDTPCIICLPITDGNPDFLHWLETETQPPARSEG